MTSATTHDTRHARSAHEATHQRSARRAQTETSIETTDAIGGQRVEPDISEFVLSAQCELALARVDGPIDVQAAFDHAMAAGRWARRAGLASLSDARIPFGFAHSATLAEGRHAGQAARACAVRLSSLPR